MGELLAFVSAIGFTVQLIFIKKGCKYKSISGSVPIMLFVVCSAMLLSFCIYSTEILLSAEKTFTNVFLSASSTALFFIVLDGLLGSMGGLFLITKATELIGPNKTSILRGVNPIFAAFFAMAFLGERPGLKGIFGIILLIISIVMISYQETDLKNDNETRKSETVRIRVGLAETTANRELTGSILAVLGGLAFAAAQIARGRAIQLDASPELVVVLGLTSSFVILSFIHLVTKKELNFVKGIGLDTYKYYLLAGAGQMIGGYALALAFVYTAVWKAVAIRNLQPIISLALSWFFLREQEIISKKLVFGAVILVMAIWITVL
jgi:drug/metabolite transporter (DMT)-like permease